MVATENCGDGKLCQREMVARGIVTQENDVDGKCRCTENAARETQHGKRSTGKSSCAQMLVIKIISE
jgi:hypothetical protein